MIHDTRVVNVSITAYIIRVAVEFRNDEHPEQARLQAALEQQHASYDGWGNWNLGRLGSSSGCSHRWVHYIYLIFCLPDQQ